MKTFKYIKEQWAKRCALDSSDENFEAQYGQLFKDFCTVRYEEALKMARWHFAYYLKNTYSLTDSLIPVADIEDEILAVYLSDPRKIDSHELDCISYQKFKVSKEPLKPARPKTSAYVTDGESIYQKGEAVTYNGNIYIVKDEVLADTFYAGNFVLWTGRILHSDQVLGNDSFIPVDLKVGDIIYHNGDFKFYDMETAEPVIDNLPDLVNGCVPNVWLLLRQKNAPEWKDDTVIPNEFYSYILRGAQADFYRSQNRTEEANIPEQLAKRDIENEMFNLENNQNIQTPFRGF